MADINPLDIDPSMPYAAAANSIQLVIDAIPTKEERFNYCIDQLREISHANDVIEYEVRALYDHAKQNGQLETALQLEFSEPDRQWVQERYTKAQANQKKFNNHCHRIKDAWGIYPWQFLPVNNPIPPRYFSLYILKAMVALAELSSIDLPTARSYVSEAIRQRFQRLDARPGASTFNEITHGDLTRAKSTFCDRSPISPSHPNNSQTPPSNPGCLQTDKDPSTPGHRADQGNDNHVPPCTHNDKPIVINSSSPLSECPYFDTPPPAPTPNKTVTARTSLSTLPPVDECVVASAPHSRLSSADPVTPRRDPSVMSHAPSTPRPQKLMRMTILISSPASESVWISGRTVVSAPPTTMPRQLLASPIGPSGNVDIHAFCDCPLDMIITVLVKAVLEVCSNSIVELANPEWYSHDTCREMKASNRAYNRASFEYALSHLTRRGLVFNGNMAAEAFHKICLKDLTSFSPPVAGAMWHDMNDGATDSMPRLSQSILPSSSSDTPTTPAGLFDRYYPEPASPFPAGQDVAEEDSMMVQRSGINTPCSPLVSPDKTSAAYEGSSSHHHTTSNALHGIHEEPPVNHTTFRMTQDGIQDTMAKMDQELETANVKIERNKSEISYAVNRLDRIRTHLARLTEYCSALEERVNRERHRLTAEYRLLWACVPSKMISAFPSLVAESHEDSLGIYLGPRGKAALTAIKWVDGDGWDFRKRFRRYLRITALVQLYTEKEADMTSHIELLNLKLHGSTVITERVMSCRNDLNEFILQLGQI